MSATGSEDHDDTGELADNDVGHHPAEVVPGSVPEPFAPRAGRLRTGAIRALIADRNYRLYWAASAVFGLSFWAFVAAMGWTALELTDSAFRVSMVTVVFFIPNLVFAVPSGVIADAWDRRAIVVGARWGSAVVVGAMVVMTMLGQLTYSWLIVFAFAVGASLTFEVASRQAVVGQIVRADQLVGATSLASMQNGLVRIAGPLTIGYLIAEFGDAAGYSFFVVCNLLMGWWFLQIRLPKGPGSSTVSARRMLSELSAGLSYLAAHRDALAVVLLSVLAGAFGWIHVAMLPLVARDTLGGDAATNGMLNMAIGLGSAPGTIMLVVIPRLRREGTVFVAAVVVWAFGIVTFALSRSLMLSIVALAVAGFGFAIQSVLTRTLLLRIVEPAYHGRVLGLLLLTYGSNVVGTLLGGMVVDRLGVSSTVALSGAAILVTVAAVVGWHRQLLRV